MRRYLVNVTPEETRLALCEDDILLEIAAERQGAGPLVGNIYKGQVQNVLPGMQAAFIDIGTEKNAFLYLGDLPEALAQAGSLSVGQELIIQIAKDAVGSKGPRATAQITLPGRYVVLMPGADYVGVSRRIEQEEERERLKELAESLRPEGMGLIVRTVAAGSGREDLEKDIAYLCNLWQTLLARHQRSQAPHLLYRDADLVIRLIRDQFTQDIEEVLVDQGDAYQRMRELLLRISQELAERVKLYTAKEDMYVRFGVEEQLALLSGREIPLDCGGFIVIDQTEALTAIDVNTGKFIGKSTLAETVYHANLEAAQVIARQLRLRDIGGIIIIDFIDMESEEARQGVMEALQKELRRDRTKTHVMGFTSLGLLEMTRKKSRQSIGALLHAPCPCCSGRGRIRSSETIFLEVARELRRRQRQNLLQGNVTLQLSAFLAEQPFLGQRLRQWEKEFCRSFSVERNTSLQPEQYVLLG